MATLRIVSNRKSDHIHEMIKSQKKTKRRRSRPRTNNISHFQSQKKFGSCIRNAYSFRVEQRSGNKLRYYEESSHQDNTTLAKKGNFGSYEVKRQTCPGKAIVKSNHAAIPAELAEDDISIMTEAFKCSVKITPPLNIQSSVTVHKGDIQNSFSALKGNAQKSVCAQKYPHANNSVQNDQKTTSVTKLPVLCMEATKISNRIIEANNLSPESASINSNMETVKLKCATASRFSDAEISIEEELSIKTKKNLSNEIKCHELFPDSIKKPKESTNVRDVAQKKPELNFFQDSFPTNVNYDDIDEAVPKFAADNLVFRLDFPNNTVIFGQKIIPYKLPDDLEKGAIIGIFISEIHNPFKFWFHIHKDNHELDLLMHQIERFYMALESDELVIPEQCHNPGQICAALYNNLWHRAEVIAQPINKRTKVFFLDYGTVSEVDSGDIKYLAVRFAAIPSQAIRGSLSHIKPRGLHWSHAATTHFLSLVCEMMLYAQVADIDKKNRVLHMVICNTNGPEVTQVNKSLVDNGFAYYYEEWMEHRIAKNGLRWHHPREDFPSFEMLEEGQYPSLAEVKYLQEKGIDYEKIIDQRIFHFGKLNNHENAPESLRDLPFHLLNSNPFKCDIIYELCRRVKLI